MRISIDLDEIELIQITEPSGLSFEGTVLLGGVTYLALLTHDTCAVFSKALTEAAGKYYGTPALAFIQKLVQHLDKMPNAVKKAQQQFITDHLPDDAGGQSHRSALRFALVGAAGEIATAWGITGWQSGEALAAAATCFKAWLAQRGGAGNQEQAAMLAQVRKYFEMQGESAFTDWDRPVSETSQHPPKTINRAGYRKHDDAMDADGNKIYLEGIDRDGLERTAKETEYYVFPEAFEKEICKGLDYRAVCRLLADKDILMTEGKSFKRNARLPGEGMTRCYRITSKIYGDDDE